MKFNKSFAEVNRTKARYKVILGSAGSGKSVNIAQDYILKLSNPMYKGCSLMVVRKSEGSNYNSTFAELCAAIGRGTFEKGGKTYPLWDIWESTKNPLSLKCCGTDKKNGRRERQLHRIGNPVIHLSAPP